MTSITVRRAVPEDTAAIVEIWQDCMDFHAARDPHFTRAADGHTRFADFISGRLRHETSCVVVAGQADQVAGYCLAMISQYSPVFRSTTYGLISDLAVRAAFRRQGIGQALVEHVLAWFGEHEIVRIELRAAISNHVAMAFWRKMGFTPYVDLLYKTL